MPQLPVEPNAPLWRRLARAVASLLRLGPLRAGRFRQPTEAEIAQAIRLLKGQVEVLEALARNVPAVDVLRTICAGATAYAGGAPCAALRLQNEPQSLSVAASAATPTGFESLVGAPSGSGSFHAAAEARFGLGAKQTAPIVGTTGELLGLLTVYGAPPAGRPVDIEWVVVTARLAALAFEKERRERQSADQVAKVTQSAKMASLGEMAAGIAHEINNPLTVINGRVAQLLPLVEQVGDEGRGEALRALDSVTKMTARIQTIIKSLRAFARNAELDELSVVRLKDVVEATLALCQEKFRATDVALTVPPVDGGIEVVGRAPQLEQVLLNLLSNAYDAVEGRVDRRVTVEVLDEGATVALVVTDNGAGVPEAVRAKVFQPFFTTKDVDKGTGLGLSISLGIAKAHGGVLELATAAGGRGAQFVLRLPKRAQNSTTRVPGRGESAA